MKPARALFVEWKYARKTHRAAVASLRDAVDKWNAFRDASGAGGSALGSARVVDGSGAFVASISYNGRAWTHEARDWKPGAQAIDVEAFDRARTCEECGARPWSHDIAGSPESMPDARLCDECFRRRHP